MGRKRSEASRLVAFEKASRRCQDKPRPGNRTRHEGGNDMCGCRKPVIRLVTEIEETVALPFHEITMGEDPGVQSSLVQCPICKNFVVRAGLCLCSVYSDPCPVHGFVHGAEAEELRKGIEQIMKHDGDEYGFRRSLQALLDKVDARDSLAYLEAKKNLDKDGE